MATKTKQKTIWYGVVITKGKIVATIYPDEDSVPKTAIKATQETLGDVTEKLYYGK